MNDSTIVRQKLRVGQGHSVVHISAANLGNIRLSLPSIDEQRAISALLDEADQSLSNFQDQAERLKAEKAALMQQLLTGKCRVKVEKRDAA